MPLVTFGYLRAPAATTAAGLEGTIVQRDEFERVQVFQITEARPSSAHSFDGFFHEHQADLSMYMKSLSGAT